MDKWEKVNSIEEDTENANKARKQKIITGTSIATIALFIILTSCSKKYFDNYNNKPIKNYTINNVSANATTENSISELEPQVNYDGAILFYNSIEKIREENPKYFTECFTSYSDVKDYVDFICYFDSLFQNKTKPDSINNLDDFLAITNSYYKDCAKYKIKPELANLFNNNPYMEEKIKTCEALANDLHNSKGNDYSEANAYYSELINNLGTVEGISTENLTNCPGCEVLISICKNYNHIGNAYQARHNEQILKVDDSDTLNIKNHVSYVCPDSAYKSIIGPLKDKIDKQINNYYSNINRVK